MKHIITNENYKQALAKGWFADAESINLSNNKNITSLPNKTKVSGYLEISVSTPLTSLPNDLKVGGNVFLRDCTSFKNIPMGLMFGLKNSTVAQIILGIFALEMIIFMANFVVGWFYMGWFIVSMISFGLFIFLLYTATGKDQ